MNVRTLLVISAAGAAVALPHAAIAQQAPGKRPMTWLDMQEMRTVVATELSPDARRMLYQVEVPDWRGTRTQSDIYLVSTERGLPSTRRLTLTDDKREARPRWTPDGQRVVFASNPDGPTQLYVMHPDSAEQRKISTAPGSVGIYDFSPDGKWLVYGAGRSRSEQQLYALSVDSILAGAAPAARQLTRHVTAVGEWRFSPDSRRIYFTAPESVDSLDSRRREARFTVEVQDPVSPLTSLWAVDLGSGSTRALVRDTSLSVGDFAVSGDGRWIGFAALPSDRFKRNAGVESVMYADQYLLDVSTGGVERLTENAEVPETPVSFSPDSRWIAFGAADGMRGVYENRRVYLRRVNDRGGKWRKLGGEFDGDVGLGFWSADSRTIYFDAGVRATNQLMALDVGTGAVRQLTNEPGVVEVWPGTDAARPLVLRYQDPTMPPNAFAVSSLADLGARSKWIQLTDVNPQLATSAFGETSEITWRSSDGTQVGGVLVKPVGYEPGKRYPLLVIAHGGPHAAETMTFNGDDNDGPQVYAGAGYLVLMPNYRGSTNYGEKFKFGIRNDYLGLSYADVMSGVDHVIAQGLADPARMGVAGHSAGGTLGNWIMTKTDRFKAISSGAGVVNWISLYGTTDFQRPREVFFDGPPYGNFDAYWDQSPLKYIRNAKTPTLIYATQGDPRVPSGQAQELYTALRRLGVPAELHIYPGSGHGTPGSRNRLAHGIAEMAWMDYYVRGSGRPFSWKDALVTLEDETKAVAPVEAAVLRRYVGEYQLAPGQTIVVTWADGVLHAQPTGRPKSPLVPESASRFWVGQAGAAVQLAFTTDAAGAVTGLVMTQGANSRTMKRLP